MNPLTIPVIFLACAVVAMAVDILVRLWRFPGRVEDPSWFWHRPAPVRSDVPIGPRLPDGSFRLPEWFGERIPYDPDPFDAEVLRESYRLLADDRVRAMINSGATEDWSPIAEVEAAEQKMQPLDDVDEWLAARLSTYDHALSLIEATVGRDADDELHRFQTGTMRLQAYRDNVLTRTGEFTPEDMAELDRRLAYV